MEKFSRYTDSDGRLIIVLARWHKCDPKRLPDGKVDLGPVTPTTVELLSVYEEKSKQISYEKFDKLVTTGEYKRIYNK